MTRAELIKKLVANNRGLTPQLTERVVKLIFEEMIIALENNERVELRGFGVLTTRARRARRGTNPATSERIDIPTRYTVGFKVGRTLYQRLNRPGTAS